MVGAGALTQHHRKLLQKERNRTMLQINLETNINNINYLKYMEDSNKTTSAEEQEKKEINKLEK